MNMTNRNSAHVEWLGSGFSPLKCLRYVLARDFPDLSIDLLISNSHGPSMYTLSMPRTYSLCSYLNIDNTYSFGFLIVKDTMVDHVTNI